VPATGLEEAPSGGGVTAGELDGAGLSEGVAVVGVREFPPSAGVPATAGLDALALTFAGAAEGVALGATEAAVGGGWSVTADVGWAGLVSLPMCSPLFIASQG
jgi:hypothetical protein